MGFPVKENKYRLELHWSKANYVRLTEVQLKDAYFCGPVLNEAAQINSNDNIVLDTTYQHSILVPSFYLSMFSWGSVNYKSDKIYLENACLKAKHMNATPKLNDTDYFVVDCYKHEEKTHQNNLTYEAYLVNENGEVYKF